MFLFELDNQHLRLDPFFFGTISEVHVSYPIGFSVQATLQLLKCIFHSTKYNARYTRC